MPTPATAGAEVENTHRQESTQPTATAESSMDQEEMEPQTANGGHEDLVEEDVEGMDVKANALMHLLNTSSVWHSFSA